MRAKRMCGAMVLVGGLCGSAARPLAWQDRSLNLPIVGSTAVFVPAEPTPRVVVFVSGDGGWDRQVTAMAQRIAGRATVVGLSFPSLRDRAAETSGCWSPALDLEAISRAAEQSLGFPRYQPPLLVGYSSGGTLVYAALVTQEDGAFDGGVSLGFCPDLPTDRSICASAAWRPAFDATKRSAWLPAARSLSTDWYILQGMRDALCPLTVTHRFAGQMSKAHLIRIVGTGHGFGNAERWGVAFDHALDDLWSASGSVTHSGSTAVKPSASTVRF